MFCCCKEPRAESDCVKGQELDLQRRLCACLYSMSSSSSQVPQIKHDIFISFRGIDTRRGFVSHLNEALCQKKIDVYVDDKLERGDEISTTLLGAIERSQISLIIFSEEYAFSKWCLDELVKIMKCFKRNGQVVIPVFYKIDPSDVRNLKGSYGDAFAEYGKEFEDNMVKVHKWSIALNKAANLSGFHSSNFRTEAELIKQIAEHVLKRLQHNHISQNNTKNLVGIHEKVAFLESLAALESKDVRVIGIWGMGGIGKTTIAKELYDRLSFEYEGCCFVANVRENLEKYGMTLIQNELFCALLEEKDQSIAIPMVGCEYNKMRLRRKKVLLVLDDVDDLRKLKNLYGERDWFGQGSRVIVTSRDKQVLTNVVNDTYEVMELKFEDSLHLFSLNAFKENYPKLEWMDLSMRAVNYAKGIPLAIEVLGSSLYGAEKEVWESQLEKLKKMPLRKVQNVLRLSYDGLDREEKEIFLYLACFFESHYFSIFLLDDCGYSTQVGLTKLYNKALIQVDNGALCNKVMHRQWRMHDLIRDMGKEIVRGESASPEKRRHLWDRHDVYQVLENATGTGAIQSLTLHMSYVSKEMHLSPKAFNGMLNLKLVNLHTLKGKVFAPKTLESLPHSLRVLSWVGCPLKFLPSSFCAENLVELDLSDGCLERLWDGVQNLVKLSYISLRGCQQLMKLPDFSKALNLKVVDLTLCTRLCDLHPSILSLHNLKILRLELCKKLKSIRSDVHLKSLLYINADGCFSLEELSVMAENMDQLYLPDTGSVQMHSIGLPLNKLEHLNCGFLESLPQNFLQALDLWDLRKFTLDFFAPRYSFKCLRLLCLRGSNIESLPASIKHLSELAEIDLKNCTKLRFLPELPPCIYVLNVSNCISLEGVSISTGDLCLHSRAYFLFSNCRRLNQQILNTIMSSVHVQMKQTAYIQHLLPYDNWRKGGKVGVVLPGSKVPAGRYDFRTTTEDTMTIQLSSLSNLVGFIFCVVTSRLCQSKNEWPFFSMLECYLQTSNGRPVQFTTGFNLPAHVPMTDMQCDHVCLWYDEYICRDLTAKIKESDVDNQCTTYAPDLMFTNFPGKQTKTKEWGIYPIYASDLFTFSDQLSLGAKTKRYRDLDDLLDMESLPLTKKLKTKGKNRLEFPTAHYLSVIFWKHLRRLFGS